AAYFETRLGLAAIGAQARAGFADIENRLQAGVVGKYLVEGPNILLLGELDVVRQHFTDADASRAQLVGYLGASTFLVRGLMAQLVLERYDEDLAVKGVARTAFGASLQWFFHAHFEAYLYGRWVVDGSGSADGASSTLVMLQVHYYLCRDARSSPVSSRRAAAAPPRCRRGSPTWSRSCRPTASAATTSRAPRRRGFGSTSTTTPPSGRARSAAPRAWRSSCRPRSMPAIIPPSDPRSTSARRTSFATGRGTAPSAPTRRIIPPPPRPRGRSPPRASR